VLCYLSRPEEAALPPGPRTDAEGVGDGTSVIERTA
jgi:hypothetical protein